MHDALRARRCEPRLWRGAGQVLRRQPRRAHALNCVPLGVIKRILSPFDLLVIPDVLLEVAALLDCRAQGVHHRVARAVACVVVDDAAGLEV